MIGLLAVLLDLYEEAEDGWLNPLMRRLQVDARFLAMQAGREVVASGGQQLNSHLKEIKVVTERCVKLTRASP